jgi:hypothetical protein
VARDMVARVKSTVVLTSAYRWRWLGHRGTAQDDEACGPDDVDEGG